MTLPDNFNQWEHFQSVVINTFRRILAEDFKDLGQDWEPDISTPRSSLRMACTPLDNDTASMLVLRLFFYYFILQRVETLIEPWYGIPIDDYQQKVEFRPQINLYFKEDEADVDSDYRALRMQISFRLMNESSTSITKTELTKIANKIKTNFSLNNGRTFKKGKELYTYTDIEKGYNIQLYAFSESEAKNLIDKVLDLNNHTFNDEFFTSHIAKNAAGKYPTIPPTRSILGESRKMARKRPVGSVRFQYATCQIWGKPQPIVLVDRSFRHFNALVDGNT